jgi:hypothetical protein
MRKVFIFCATLAGVLVMPQAAQSQTRSDTASVLLSAARKLQSEGQGGAARAVLALLRSQYGGTAAADTAGMLISRATTTARNEESGKVELTVWSTAYGVSLGIATPIMMDSEEPAAYGVALLTGAPLGFFASRAYIKAHPDITVGQARAITFGGSWGAWQGYGWTEVLGRKDLEGCGFGDCGHVGPSNQTTIAGTIAGSLVGIAAGAVAARKPINAGVAASVSASSLWGTWLGLSLGVIGNAENENLLAATLIGGDVAVATAGLLAPRIDPSVNRVRLVSLSGLVGGVAGAGLDLIVQPDDEDVAIGIPLATSLIGLALGAHATRDYDRDRSAAIDRQGSALLHWNPEDGMRVTLPGAVPTFRKDERGGRTRLQPAVAVNLFSARF